MTTLKSRSRLSNGDLLELRQFDTPTLHNGWEQYTKLDSGREGFNLESVQDYMPEMGLIAGYAVTLVIEPSNHEHVSSNPNAWSEYRRYVGEFPGPKIVVVQDLDKPYAYGSVFGEVNANVHRALGCVGVIVDGAIRDVPQMKRVGFKGLARQLCVGHAYGTPVRWNCNVEIFGCQVKPGQLVVADQHGFLAIPAEDEAQLLEAARFMDKNEHHTKIAAACNPVGKTIDEILQAIDQANIDFRQAALSRFGKPGEG